MSRSSSAYQTTHAIILAAGFGSRLGAQEGHKLLARIGDRSLLDYHLDNFSALGVQQVTVVTGYRNDALAANLRRHSVPQGMTLKTAYNADFESSNGISVLAGVDEAIDNFGVDEALPLWLTMSDHIFEPDLFVRLRDAFIGGDPPDCQGMLGVDHKLDTIFDMPDANKIGFANGQLSDIGKSLDVFEMIDVGFFWCNHGFVEALRAEKQRRGDCTTSDAVRRLAAEDAFCFWDVGECLWQDVDTPEAREHAKGLVEQWDE
jgi:1L-myo-inositol 1-phosphate cytidylyltransferase